MLARSDISVVVETSTANPVLTLVNEGLTCIVDQHVHVAKFGCGLHNFGAGSDIELKGPDLNPRMPCLQILFQVFQTLLTTGSQYLIKIDK
jgi:hypothetical protein